MNTLNDLQKYKSVTKGPCHVVTRDRALKKIPEKAITFEFPMTVVQPPYVGVQSYLQKLSIFHNQNTFPDTSKQYTNLTL